MKLLLVIAASAFAILASSNASLAQGTAFTYQGRLTDGTNAASGTYDLRFAICDAAANGAQLGGALTNLATSVSNGLFTVTLDFGAGVFTGAARWLEIAVRTNGGGAFTTLSPRQALTPTPYATFAGGANGAGISGTIPAGTIGNGTITSNMLAPGAAAANLAASGQSAVPSGAGLISLNDNDTNLVAAGCLKTAGYVYLANTWKQLLPSSPPVGRGDFAWVWTGNKMIIWGGYTGSGSDFQNVNDGGCYDAAANSWSPVTTNGAPSPREADSAVWTGTEMIIWGGYSYDTSYHYFNDGGRYNPVANTWSAVATNGALAARRGHTAVWTGTEMIVWGGGYYDGGTFSEHDYNDGWRYNPVSNSWSQISAGGAPAPRFGHTAIWTGSEMIVWGGWNGATCFLDGGRYNPATDTWTPMAANGPPFSPPWKTPPALWTGNDMFVGNGRYNPASDSWLPANLRASGSEQEVWTGSEVLAWGDGVFNQGGSYNPVSDTWTLMNTNDYPVPPARSGYAAFWTGSAMIIWGGTYYGCLNDTWSTTPPKRLYLYLRP